VARHCTYAFPLDSSLFTPLQLQPTAVGRLGFSAGSRWLKENVCSHRDLIWEHKIGLVLWAWELEFREPLGFRDADEAELDVTARVRGPRTQFEVEMTISGPAGVAVAMRAVLVPLALSGDAALSGRPSPLPEELLAAFREDEIEPVPYRSKLRRMQSEIEQAGRPLAATEEEFRVHRHHCEVADQWFWAESLGFAAAGREELVTQHAATRSDLSAGLGAPIRRIDVACAQTFQFRDLGRVSTTAYDWGDRLAFVHELGLNDNGARDVHATAIEQF
jgi:acyl-CoA thioesterase FadM